jgi:GDPmannose 4,6-dehydratase
VKLSKKALVTGITGQDGYHLTQLLLGKDYEIIGLTQKISGPSSLEFKRIFPDITLIEAQLQSFEAINEVILKTRPSEIYNLGAISFVGTEIQKSEEIANVTGNGFVRIAESVRRLNPENAIRIYQASSSEMFGSVLESPQRESSTFMPTSPYGVSKLFAHQMARVYRESYDMFITSGILFNHEGEFRRHEYVTRKITSNVAKIKMGKIKKFALGDLEARRDWGYAGDFVEAIWRMMQHEKPEEFVVATGVLHSVRDFVETALQAAGLESDVEKYVDYDPSMVRQSPNRHLVGDSTKARELLNWSPKVNFENLVQLMVEKDLQIESQS